MKYYTKYILLFIFFLFVCLEDRAQSLSILNKDLQKVRVGLVDEFFDRFNGKIAHPDIPITDNKSRSDNLMYLLDLAQFTSKEDPRFQEALEMMNVIINDSVKINFTDTTWFAIAHCKGLLEGKSVMFNLYLTVQQRKQNMYKWVISRVDGNLFEIKPRNENEKIMLAPGDHETNFMSLGRMTKEQPFNVKNFISKGFEYDMTSVFAYLVYNRKLKIDYVNELEFVFTQVPGYIFHVKYLERENKNSGWLISDFYKSTDEDKATFIGHLYPRNVEVLTIRDSDEISEKPIVDDTINLVKPHHHKEMFIKRRAEKLRQLLDNIAFMQSKDTLRSRSLYQAKTESLFADSSRVHLQYRKKSQNRIVDVPEFCRMLIDGDIKFDRIDSVCVPLWDEKINSLPSNVNKTELASFILPYEVVKGEILYEKPNSILKLYAYKEETEDGVEWIPILGDIFIKVRK